MRLYTRHSVSQCRLSSVRIYVFGVASSIYRYFESLSISPFISAFLTLRKHRIVYFCCGPGSIYIAIYVQLDNDKSFVSTSGPCSLAVTVIGQHQVTRSYPGAFAHDLARYGYHTESLFTVPYVPFLCSARTSLGYNIPDGQKEKRATSATPPDACTAANSGHPRLHRTP
ncbi:hypothetical protein DL770_002789 [Monosporascus sp. CRB-9-2]|nr:hypothetical protein DL770_002789 [Monosporascus sp. CRB-9-2]